MAEEGLSGVVLQVLEKARGVPLPVEEISRRCRDDFGAVTSSDVYRCLREFTLTRVVNFRFAEVDHVFLYWTGDEATAEAPPVS